MWKPRALSEVEASEKCVSICIFSTFPNIYLGMWMVANLYPSRKTKSLYN